MHTSVTVRQFYDKGLSHSSYAVLGEQKIILVDPARDPQPYLAFAAEHRATIVGVIETHPHADFVSAHLELQQLGATVYTSKLTGAGYPHVPFDDGDEIALGEAVLSAVNTPGHSPDSICIVLKERGRITAVFTGDTLFAGDVGRPDLRENTPGAGARKEELARAMYASTRNRLMTLPEEAKVFPSHGPGSLCGKHMSPELWSTIGTELRSNYALQPMDEDHFVQLIIAEQPFIPAYFGYDVELNKKGTLTLDQALGAVPRLSAKAAQPGTQIVDTRPAAVFRTGHAPHAINIPDGNAFETWLGTIVAPGDDFYLLAGDEKSADDILRKAAKIGYEQLTKGLLIGSEPGPVAEALPDQQQFKRAPQEYTIVDIRNESETRDKKIFAGALIIPLPELQRRVAEIPSDRPVVVHCAGGYRSAIGSSIISRYYPNLAVYDFGEAIAQYS